MRKTLSLATAVLLLGSSAALAQYQGDNRGGDQQRSYGEQQRGYGEQSQQYQAPAARGGERGDQNRQVSDTPHWSRGDRLPQDYAGSNHVSDWKNRHLRQPPRGYHWVQSGNDYVLARMANGMISQVVHSQERTR